MPVISIPNREEGILSASALTSSCVVVVSRAGLPAWLFCSPTMQGERMDSARFAAFLQGPGWSGIGPFGRMLLLRNESFDHVWLTNVQLTHGSFLARNRLFLILNMLPRRLAWVRAELMIKRRTALAMAGHPRLGGTSALRVLGSDLLKMIGRLLM